VTPNARIWSSVASRVEDDSSSRGASNVTVWRGDADATAGTASMAISIRRRSRGIRERESEWPAAGSGSAGSLFPTDYVPRGRGPYREFTIGTWLRS
jgi:hypothetical protein